MSNQGGGPNKSALVTATILVIAAVLLAIVVGPSLRAIASNAGGSGHATAAESAVAPTQTLPATLPPTAEPESAAPTPSEAASPVPTGPPDNFVVLYCRAYSLYLAATSNLLSDVQDALTQSAAGLVADSYVRTVMNSYSHRMAAVINAFGQVPVFAPANEVVAAWVEAATGYKRAVDLLYKGFSLSPAEGQTYIDQATALFGGLQETEGIAANDHAAFAAQYGVTCP